MRKNRCFRAFRSSLLLISAFVVLLQSCVKYEEKPIKKPVTQPTTPTQPQPQAPQPQPSSDKSCSSNLLYGYTDKTSYFPDEKVKAYLQSNVAVDLCRLDIYNALGALAFSVSTSLKVQYVSIDKPFMKGYGFDPTVEFEIPANLSSGIYLISNSIPFVVKTKEQVDLLVVYPSNTANAYCESGGKSLYTVPLSDRPPIVSFHRPIDLQYFSVQCVHWFAGLNEYKVGYVADSDLDDYSTFYRASILVIIGHNEYWTRKGRLNFDQYVNSGKHALILSGNTMWWQVRYSPDGSQLICYRDQKLDPEPNILLKTEYWGNPILQYSIFSSIGADFPSGGYGLQADLGWNGYKITSPDSPLLEGTGLKKGDIISLPTSEYDGAPISSFDGNGYPILDQAALHVNRLELIGFDRSYREKPTFGTFIIFQRNPTSGIIVNTATTDWCSDNGMGGLSGDVIKKITSNAIRKLVHGDEIFTP